MKITKIEAIADEGKYIARKGTDSYFTRCTIMKGETEKDFIEVDTIPEPSDLPPFKERVIARVRERYSMDDELAILRQKDSKPEEYEEYFDYVEAVKAEERNG